MPPVILISLDGVRPDALTTASCPALHSVREQGASTLCARSVFPSITLPCHTSIFHFVPPSRHGITSNIFTPMARPLPGIVEIARASEKRVAFFYNWEHLRDLARPGSWPKHQKRLYNSIRDHSAGHRAYHCEHFGDTGSSEWEGRSADEIFQ